MSGDVEDFRANDADSDGIDDAPEPSLRDRFDRLPAPLRWIGWLFGVTVAVAMVLFVDGTSPTDRPTIADPSQTGADEDTDSDLAIEPTSEAISSPSEPSTPDELEPSPSGDPDAANAVPPATGDPTSEPSPTETSTSTPRGDSAPVIRSSVVTNIVDGDTVDIGDGTRVRLAIVDTPETHGGKERCGSEASTFASDFIRGEPVDIYRPEGAPVTDSFGRLLGEVVRRSDGASLNVALAAAGLGTVDERFTDEDPDLARRARAAEASAGEPSCEPVAQPSPSPSQTATSAPPPTGGGSGSVAISTIRYDGPGGDVEYGDSEYVELVNNGSAVEDVSGWSLTDEADHVIRIPSGFKIEPGTTLRVYTGPGENTEDRYYHGAGQAIWNNDGGDTATLRDASGAVIDTYSY